MKKNGCKYTVTYIWPKKNAKILRDYGKTEGLLQDKKKHNLRKIHVLLLWPRSKWDIWCLLGITEKINILVWIYSIRRADQRQNWIGFKRWWHTSTHVKRTISDTRSSSNNRLKQWDNTATPLAVPEATKRGFTSNKKCFTRRHRQDGY